MTLMRCQVFTVIPYTVPSTSIAEARNETQKIARIAAMDRIIKLYPLAGVY